MPDKAYIKISKGLITQSCDFYEYSWDWEKSVMWLLWILMRLAKSDNFIPFTTSAWIPYKRKFLLNLYLPLGKDGFRVHDHVVCVTSQWWVTLELFGYIIPSISQTVVFSFVVFISFSFSNICFQSITWRRPENKLVKNSFWHTKHNFYFDEKKKSFGIADNCNLINLTLERRKYKMIFNEKNEHLQWWSTEKN